MTRINLDREDLIALLEAFAGVAEVLDRERALYKDLLILCCREKGLQDEEIDSLVHRCRIANSERMGQTLQKSHAEFLAKLPQLVDLLASDLGTALKAFHEIKPTSRPN